MWVAVDAMSGDCGIEPLVEGSAMAAKELNAKVILVGDEGLLKKSLEQYPEVADNIRIQKSTQVIQMDEPPAMAVRSKKDSSVVVAAKLVKESEAIGYFSPGNTGATMASAMTVLGRIQGVKRPSIATPVPRGDGGATTLVDSGGNVDCKPEYLIQFAIMGEVYAREILGVINPKIGVLSNGEEDGKGNELSLKVFDQLQKLPYDFVGNVEGRDLFGQGKSVDVAVCDGFVGNVALKSMEGMAKVIFSIFRKKIKSSSLAKAGALLLKSAFMEVRSRVDYTSYGGAPLLGTNGVCMIGHGSSDKTAVFNAIRVTLEFAQNDVNLRIRENIKRFS